MPDLTGEQASAEAVHKAKNAAAAVELSREVHLEETIQKTAQQTKAALLEGLKEVFRESDDDDPKNMVVLWKRIPVLCTSVEQIRRDQAAQLAHLENTDKSVEKINANISRVVWVVILAVLGAVLKLILIK